MMRGLLCLIVILVVTSCNKSPSADHALPDFSGVYKHQGETYFKFTNRGIEYDGRTNERDDPLNSMAIINKNTDKGHKVSISALDADAPKGQTVKTGMLITIYLGENELKKGTYPIVSDRMTRDCIDREFKGCNIISHVGISPHIVDENGITDVEYNAENLLNSFSG